MIVCAVGVHSQWGLILAELDTEEEDTPLQQDLEGLATSMHIFFFFFGVKLLFLTCAMW